MTAPPTAPAVLTTLLEIVGVTAGSATSPRSTTSRWTIAENEFFALLGPSGCGKTTLLRVARRLRAPGQRRGPARRRRTCSGCPPHRRPVNLMFQSYALFPHMTVERNVAYGLERERLPRARGRGRGWPRCSRPSGLTAQAGRRPAAALRRAAAAGRPGPGDREAAPAAAARRAAVRAGPQGPRGDAARAQAAPARGRHHLRRGHPRPGGGDVDGRPDRGHGDGPGPADRHARRALPSGPANLFVADFIGTSNLFEGTGRRRRLRLRAARQLPGSRGRRDDGAGPPRRTTGGRPVVGGLRRHRRAAAAGCIDVQFKGGLQPRRRRRRRGDDAVPGLGARHRRRRPRGRGRPRAGRPRSSSPRPACDAVRSAPAARPRPVWWEGREAGAVSEPLRGTARADLLVVGGGFTGLWAAIQAVDEHPGRAVVCHRGAARRRRRVRPQRRLRLALPDPRTRARRGDSGATRCRTCCASAARTCVEIEEFLAKEEIAADLRLCGKTMFATRPHEVAALQAAPPPAPAARRGVGRSSPPTQARADVRLADLPRWPDAALRRAGRPGRARHRAPGRGTAHGASCCTRARALRQIGRRRHRGALPDRPRRRTRRTRCCWPPTRSGHRCAGSGPTCCRSGTTCWPPSR